MFYSRKRDVMKFFLAFCLQDCKRMLTFAVSIPFTPYKSGKKWNGQLHNVKASLMLCLLVDEPRKFITNIKRHCQQWTLAAYAITVSRNVEGETCVLSLAHSGYTLYILTWVLLWLVGLQVFLGPTLRRARCDTHVFHLLAFYQSHNRTRSGQGVAGHNNRCV